MRKSFTHPLTTPTRNIKTGHWRTEIGSSTSMSSGWSFPVGRSTSSYSTPPPTSISNCEWWVPKRGVGFCHLEKNPRFVQASIQSVPPAPIMRVHHGSWGPINSPRAATVLYSDYESRDSIFPIEVILIKFNLCQWLSCLSTVQMPLCGRREGMGFQISFRCKIICICKSAKISEPKYLIQQR